MKNQYLRTINHKYYNRKNKIEKKTETKDRRILPIKFIRKYFH